MRIFRHYIPWHVFLLVIVEGAIIFGSVYSGYGIKFFGFEPLWLGFDPIYPKACTLSLVTIMTFYVANLYDLSLGTRKKELCVRMGGCFLVTSFVVAALSFLIPLLRLSRSAYSLSLGLSLPVIVGFRLFYYWVIKTRQLQAKVLILGDGWVAHLLSAELENGNNPGFTVLGFLAEHSNKTSEGLLGEPPTPDSIPKKEDYRG